MGLHKHGILIDCSHCICASSCISGWFDVMVPVFDDDNGQIGTAKLHCIISAECHRVELVELQGAGDDCTNEALRVIMDRLLAALEFVANKKLCGNSRICPSEVVRIVNAQN